MLSKVLVCRIADGMNHRPRLGFELLVFIAREPPSVPRRLYSTSGRKNVLLKDLHKLRNFSNICKDKL